MADVIELILGFGLLLTAVGMFFGFFGVLAELGITPYIIIILGLLTLIFGGKMTRGGPGFGQPMYGMRTQFRHITRWFFGPYLIFVGLVSLIESLGEMFLFISTNSYSGLLILGAIGAIEMFISVK